ncbi:alanine--tRNA ligase-related protein, partial [Hansschlegelia beijingensis]
ATETVWFGLRERVGPTEFLGYGVERAEGAVVALVKDGQEVERLEAGERGLLVTNQTPFYGESGGQVGDVGELSGNGVRLVVTDTQKKLGDLFVHVVEVREGAVAVGDGLTFEVDHERRRKIRGNHSATHLLHEALRLTLGDHIAQKGSLVAPDRLRFDFSHPKPIGDEELGRIETLANAIVLQNDPVTTRVMGVEEAMKSGARALFGEKYGDEVRVVSMGKAEDGERAFSIELCGGTHVDRRRGSRAAACPSRIRRCSPSASASARRCSALASRSFATGSGTGRPAPGRLPPARRAPSGPAS